MKVEEYIKLLQNDPQFMACVTDWRAGLERINSQARYDELAGSGLFTLVREDDGRDTRDQVCEKLARHFGLVEQ